MITDLEIVAVFNSLIENEIELSNLGKYCAVGKNEYQIGDWFISIHFDIDELDYISKVVAPDGRERIEKIQFTNIFTIRQILYLEEKKFTEWKRS